MRHCGHSREFLNATAVGHRPSSLPLRRTVIPSLVSPVSNVISARHPASCSSQIKFCLGLNCGNDLWFFPVSATSMPHSCLHDSGVFETHSSNCICPGFAVKMLFILDLLASSPDAGGHLTHFECRFTPDAKRHRSSQS